jgi:hypothetical protein
MQEWAIIKIAGGVGGAVGTFAAIVAKKDVGKIEAYSIVTVGVSLSIFLPTVVAKYLVIRYGLVDDFDTLLGLTGLLGLLFGLIGFKIIGGIYKLSSYFESNPIPFLRKFLGLFGGEK